MAKKDIKSVLNEGKVIIRYIRDNSRYNGKHLLAGGMHKDGGRELTIRRENGLIIPFLTAEEIESLSDVLGEDLSYSNDKFWRAEGRFDVKLINGDIILDKSKPIDYIKWKFLKMYDMLIAPNWDHRQDMATYKWAIIEEDTDGAAANQELNIVMRAYMLFGKYENDKKVLSYLYYRLESKNVDPNIKMDVLRGWFKPILESKATLFVRFADDSLLDEKVTIYLAKQKGIIKIVDTTGILYYGDVKLTPDPKVGGDEMAAQYISTNDNQMVKFEIQGKLNN